MTSAFISSAEAGLAANDKAMAATATDANSARFIIPSRSAFTGLLFSAQAPRGLLWLYTPM
jgi:hypothetical protein